MRILDVEIHQGVDFGTRPLPFFLRAETVQREGFKLEPGTMRDDSRNPAAPSLCPLNPRQPALIGPAPIAVHDNGHMRGNWLRSRPSSVRGSSGG
jgi:hypothetical protein